MKKLVFIAACAVPWGLTAQTLQLISAGGQQLNHADGQISASIGEPCIGRIGTGDAIITVGFQQADVAAVSAVVTESPLAPISRLYPNPAIDRMRIEFAAASEYQLRLYDAMGRLMASRTVTEPTVEWNVAELPAGLYRFVILPEQAGATSETLPFEKIRP